MATIRPRKQADGSTRYTAIVRIRRGKTIVYQEYKTFAQRVAAVSWGRKTTPPAAQRRLPDIQPLTVLANSFHDEVHVGVLLISV